jgi:FkbM family methyltransferase
MELDFHGMNKDDENFVNRRNEQSLIKNLIDKIIIHILHKYSKKNISSHDQLAVFAFDHIAHHINIKGIYEKEHLEAAFSFLEKYSKLRKGETAVDIGANIGNHSLFFSKYFKKVISIEPDLNNFELLEINSRLKNNIECLNIGISDQNYRAKFKKDKLNRGASKLDKSGDCSIELRTLDSLNMVENIGLVKIDVEGHELEVIKGARQTLISKHPVLLFELNAKQLSKDYIDEFIHLLKGMGYLNFYSCDDKQQNTHIFNRTFFRIFLENGNIHIRKVEAFTSQNYPLIISF